MDPETGRTYEDLFCTGTGQQGVALLGDSAGAHFHLPPEWLNVTELNAGRYKKSIHMACAMNKKK